MSFSIHHDEDTPRLCLTGEIGFRYSAAEVICGLGDAGKIHLVIDSPGGDGLAALALYDHFKTRNVTCEIIGQCASAATVVMMAANHIACQPATRIMLHEPSPFIRGTRHELRAEADRLDAMVNRLVQVYSDRTKQSIKTVRRWVTKKDKWFDASQAVAVGLVDEILEPQPARLPRRTLATAGEVKPAMPESERMMRFFLAAFGKIEVSDRDRFLRDLEAWTFANVAEKTICGCD